MIYTSEAIFEAQLSFRERAEKLIQQLNEKIYTVKDTDISYRLMNHWCEKGLIDDNRDSDSKWRKLSVVDIIQIAIFNRLRKYGYSIEKLHKVKKALDIGDDNGIPNIELAFACCKNLNRQMFLFVDVEGNAAIGDETSVSSTDESFQYPDLLRINFNKLLSKIFQRANFVPKEYFYSQCLSDLEREVMDIIREGTVETISVTPQNGIIEAINVTQTYNRKEIELNKLFSEIEHGEITIKRKGGHNVHITATKRRAV